MFPTSSKSSNGVAWNISYSVEMTTHYCGEKWSSINNCINVGRGYWLVSKQIGIMEKHLSNSTEYFPDLIFRSSVGCSHGRCLLGIPIHLFIFIHKLPRKRRLFRCRAMCRREHRWRRLFFTETCTNLDWCWMDGYLEFSVFEMNTCWSRFQYFEN